MTHPKYLKKRGDIWYVQMRVPTDLVQHIGATTKIRSLKTRDEAEALRRRHAVVAEFQAEFDQAARMPPPPSRLEALLERACQLYEQHGGRPAEHDDLSIDHVSIDAEVDSIIASYPVDSTGEPKVPLADSEMLERINAAASGMAGALLETLSARWLEAEAEKRDKKASTIGEKRTHITSLLTYVGKTSTPQELTREAAVGYVEKVLNPMEVTLERKQYYVQTCTQFCKWLRVRSLIKENPFEDVGILLHAKKGETLERRVWEASELTNFLDSVPLMGDIWQLIVLVAYTAARPQELCNVRIQDITDVSISISDSKTKAGIRTIPIHPVIRPLVAYLAKTSGDGYLISGQKPSGDDGNRYKLLGKRIRTARKNLNCDPSALTYTLRHTAITQMTDADHPKKVIEAIVGHKDGSVLDEHYVKSKKLEKMLEALQSVTYGELDAKIRSLCPEG